MRRPHAHRGGLHVIPLALMLENGRPRVARDKDDHQQEEQPQEVDVDRADAFVTFVVRLENGLDHSSRVLSYGRAGYHAGTSKEDAHDDRYPERPPRLDPD